MVTPYFAITALYDDNLFASSSQPESDLYMRLTPGLQTSYRWTPNLALTGQYSLEGEIYRTHSELNTPHTRQSASADLVYSPERFSTVTFSTTYADTLRPGDLVQQTGLDLGRVRSEAYSSGLTLERRVSPRDSWSLVESYRHFSFGSGGSVGSSLVAAEWARQLTARTSFSIRGGPRFTQGGIDPDVAASVKWRLDQGELSVNYARGRNPAPVRDLSVITEGISASAGFLLWPTVRLAITPSVYRNTRGDAEARIYRLSLDGEYRVWKSVTLRFSEQLIRQESRSDLGGAVPGEETIRHDIFLLSLTVASPERIP